MNLQFFQNLIITALCCAALQQSFVAAEDHGTKLQVLSTDACLTVTDGDLPVLQYQLQVHSEDGKWPRNNYVHPLYDFHGRIITEDFPADHKHHRGIFWATAVAVSADQPLSLKYRLVIHRGAASQVDMSLLAAAYGRPPDASADAVPK